MTGARTHDKDLHLQPDIEHDVEHDDCSWSRCMVAMNHSSKKFGIGTMNAASHLIKHKTRSLSSVG
jgi:hypothetical protein